MTDNNPNKVYYEAPPTRPAPVTQTGVIGWVRKNLLASWLDVFLTLIFTFIVVSAVVSFVVWTISNANWWAVSFNFRQFMMGGYEPALEWRLSVAVLFTVVAMGMAVAVWVQRIVRIAAGLIIFTLAFVWLVPALSTALIPIPPVYVAVGNAPIAVDNVNETARPRLAFVGRAGETITVQIAPISTDEQLAALTGFMDMPTNGMRVIAERRLQAAVTRAEIEAQLAAHAASPIRLLTEGQIARLETQLNRLIDIPPVTETLNFAQGGAVVEVLDADGNSIAPAVNLPTANERATFTLPADGWYILHTTGDDDTSINVLAVNGMQPLLQSSVLQPGGGFITNYTRMIDLFAIRGIRAVDDRAVPFFDYIRNQYWGERPFTTYLRLFLAPFLSQHALNLTYILLAGVAGYWALRAVQRWRGAAAGAQVATVALALTPAVIWIMATGLNVPDILNLTVVVGGVFAVLLARALGARFGRQPVMVAVVGAVAALAWGMPLAVFNPHYGFGLLALVNFFSPLLIFIFWVIGSDSYHASDQAEYNRQVGLYSVLTLTFLVVPYLLVQVFGVSPSASYPDWFLRQSDQRLWGGLLLTFILTIYGIVFSFPIGILLALGRRSNLPVIKYGCTLYIELVRGSPFITVLFLAQLFIPLINPEFASVPGTIRALVATIMFSAAYLAENVRGGLQSLPPGQTEAGKSLGLSGWQVIYYITLPQALRAVIPAILGSFVSLFKDTSLVAIVGLTDLTGFVNIMVVQPAFTGTRAEGLLFITLIYFFFSYVMSYVSRLLEASGSGSTRRI
ncbi:amino acid ABC transporter permease [Aggregatilineales bacterium SYSU G02658]